MNKGVKMNIKSQILKFVHENFLHANPENELEEDQSFLDSGIIDSTGVLELVTFVEETFKINIEDDELIPENLDSVEKLTHFIQRKKEHSLVIA